jgi:hypothetical protein
VERTYTRGELDRLHFNPKLIERLRRHGVITPTSKVNPDTGRTFVMFTQGDIATLERETLRNKQESRRRLSRVLANVARKDTSTPASQQTCSVCGKTALYMVPRGHSPAVPRCAAHKGVA